MSDDLNPQQPRDAGMTLIEVVVAFTLFMVMAASVLTVLGAAVRTTKDDKQRLEAVNLATRELEITRDVFASTIRGPDQVVDNRVLNPSPLPSGTAGQPLVVDGVPYTVERTAQWSTSSGAASVCDDATSSELAYMRVKVEVSWPSLGTRPPVTMQTVMTPRKGTYSTLDGHIALKVIDSAGQPKEGVPVTATSGSVTKTGTTASDGCVLLAHLDAGTWTVKASSPGFVSRAGDPTATTTVALQAGQLWRSTIEYDQAATISATLTTSPGYALPQSISVNSATTGVPLTLGNSGIQPRGATTVTGTTATRLVANLWPYPSGYQLWAGGCKDGNPALTGTNLPVPVTRGATSTATVALAPVEVRTSSGGTITAVHDPNVDTMCPTGATLTLGVATNGSLKTSLPYGAWTIMRGGSEVDVVIKQDGTATVVPL